MNEILYQQSKKLRAMTEFAKDFQEVYKLQENELGRMKEECMSERVAITALKQGKSRKEYELVLFKTAELSKANN